MQIAALNKPIPVSWLLQTSDGGKFGLSFCPGIVLQRGALNVNRSLTNDLAHLKQHHGVTTIVCLLNVAELATYKLRNYVDVCTREGFEVVSFPIVEMRPPENLEQTLDIVDFVVNSLSKRETVLAHCKGGLGRAGLLAACVMLRLGIVSTPQDAISKVRQLRSKSAIETTRQEEFIHKFSVFIGKSAAPLTCQLNCCLVPS